MRPMQTFFQAADDKLRAKPVNANNQRLPAVKIILVNKFLFAKGGDAVCTLATRDLLASRGHEVFCWGMDHPSNPAFPHSGDFVSHVDYEHGSGVPGKIHAAANILYSFEARRKFERFVEKVTPDIVHLNNFAHQISPSILHVLKRRRIPTVMTMHDYKMVCPSYQMFSGGSPCERCKGGAYYWCTVRKCTKGSYAKSFINTIEMYLHHRIMGIYGHIHTFISPSRFLAEKVREMGLKGNFRYLPNFVDIDDFPPCSQVSGLGCVYVGRLSHEKGLLTLLEAVKGLNIELTIIGEGPLRAEMEKKIEREKIENVSLLGYMTDDGLREQICKSKFLVVPSEWYENNPRTIIESFCLGKPVLGAKVGGIPELVIDGRTGRTFTPGKVDDLRKKIIMMDLSTRLSELGNNARRFAEENLTAEKHYHDLMNVYHRAINNK